MPSSTLNSILFHCRLQGLFWTQCCFRPYIAGGALLGAAAFHFLRSQQKHKKVHVLLVELSFASVADREKWTSSWEPLAKRVFTNEPNCLSYELCIANDDPKSVIIYERFVLATFVLFLFYRLLTENMFRAHTGMCLNLILMGLTERAKRSMPSCLTVTPVWYQQPRNSLISLKATLAILQGEIPI